MKIIPLTKEKFEQWDRFCLDSDDSWFWHTTDWMGYTLNLRDYIDAKSLYFMVELDNKIIALCPLFLETKDNISQFSFGESPLLTPVFDNDLAPKHRNKLMKLIFNHIDYLAKENNVKRVSIRFSPLSTSFLNSKTPPYNYLMKYGYNDISINTQIVDLLKSLKQLRLEISHGHDAAINSSSKILKPAIFDKLNITSEIFEEYVNLHHKAAGRVTRQRTTFNMMYTWLKNGSAFLVGAKKSGEFVGFSYFFVFKDNAYYGSACNDPEISDISIAHFIQWNAIEYMHKSNYQFYELGWQKYTRTLLDFPSEKEINISKFKRGFGGFTVPLFIAEKYYDKDHFLKINNERTEKYVNYLDGKYVD